MCALVVYTVMGCLGFLIVKSAGGTDDAALVFGILMCLFMWAITQRNTEDR